MKRALVVIHRWLGVAFCLLFAMWFASGIVMHFMPFPALTEAERVAGLAPFDPNLLRVDPRAAIAASGLTGAVRVRAFARNDGPIYIVLGASGLRAFKGPELAPAGAVAAHDALAIAAAHARRRGITSDAAAFAELAHYDQWTVSNRLDPHRPLYRIALNDEAATELYVSSTTGEVVRDTNARERGWNYVGSVAHWIYPTFLRRNLDAWLVTVWWLALAALIAAITGTIRRAVERAHRGRALALALLRMAGVAPLARLGVHRFYSELDFQRVAIDGSGTAVFERQTFAGGGRDFQ